jgi:hypothetical protein
MIIDTLTDLYVQVYNRNGSTPGNQTRPPQRRIDGGEWSGNTYWYMIR